MGIVPKNQAEPYMQSIIVNVYIYSLNYSQSVSCKTLCNVYMYSLYSQSVSLDCKNPPCRQFTNSPRH